MKVRGKKKSIQKKDKWVGMGPWQRPDLCRQIKIQRKVKDPYADSVAQGIPPTANDN